LQLRRRIVLTTTLVTAVALGGAFFAISTAFTRLQEGQLDGELVAVARSEAREAPSFGFSFNEGPGPPTNDVGPLTKHGVIYGDDDRPVSVTAPFDVHAPERRTIEHPSAICFDFRHDARHYRGVFVGIPGHPKKAVLLAALREDLDADERFLRDAMAFAFIVALFWAALVANFVVRRLTREHERIAEVANRVTSGDLTARVSATSGDREAIKLSRDVDEMIDTISTLMSSQRRFVAHAAHELRSPLTKLYGELQLAVRKERDATVLRRAIHEALESTRALKSLTDDLLSLAKVASGDTAKEDTVLASVVENAVALTRALAEEHKVSFSTAGLDVHLFGRPNDLSRLFRNLLENAVTHSPEGGTVRVHGSVKEQRVRITVEDEGEGVPEEDRDRIFEPFYRSAKSKSRASGGSGLGLGIAREIAKSHRGELSLDQGDRGARFVVELPVASPHDRAPPSS
jgi:two-component system, OmpR family, sensor kinase